MPKLARSRRVGGIVALAGIAYGIARLQDGRYFSAASFLAFGFALLLILLPILDFKKLVEASHSTYLLTLSLVSLASAIGLGLLALLRLAGLFDQVAFWFAPLWLLGGLLSVYLAVRLLGAWRSPRPKP